MVLALHALSSAGSINTPMDTDSVIDKLPGSGGQRHFGRAALKRCSEAGFQLEPASTISRDISDASRAAFLSLSAPGHSDPAVTCQAEIFYEVKPGIQPKKNQLQLDGAALHCY